MVKREGHAGPGGEAVTGVRGGGGGESVWRESSIKYSLLSVMVRSV